MSHCTESIRPRRMDFELPWPLDSPKKRPLVCTETNSALEIQNFLRKIPPLFKKLQHFKKASNMIFGHLESFRNCLAFDISDSSTSHLGFFCAILEGSSHRMVSGNKKQVPLYRWMAGFRENPNKKRMMTGGTPTEVETSRNLNTSIALGSPHLLAPKVVCAPTSDRAGCVGIVVYHCLPQI